MENKCYLCPNMCGVNRAEEKGRCNSSDKMKIAKFYPHMFEEPVLSGTKGSGTIFFTGCGLRCVFCQNYIVSRNETGKEITPRELTDIFKKLEDTGVHNINLVTPTHFVPQIAEAFKIYRPQIPVIYNTHSYETVDTLRIIDEFVDIYLPDMKFHSPEISFRYTGERNYFETASKAIEFMMKSKKKKIGEDGLMKQGVIVRHMIMPLCVEDSIEILKWFKKSAVNGAAIALMAQYTPFGNIENYPELKRTITKREYDRVYGALLDLGISDYYAQELKSASESFIPKWDF